MRNQFRSIQTILNSTGSLLLILGGFLLVPLVVGFLYGEVEAINFFLLPSLLSFFLGIVCRSLFRSDNPSITQAMLICSLGWLVCSAIGALPFVFGSNASYLNGFFEAMSGFTTTGITMFTGLDYMPKSILFWRSLTQWIGGLGILTFFLAVTYRGGSAHRLFGAETHKIGMDRPVPGLANTLKILWTIYAGYTLLVIIGLLFAGVSLFDSICHSFTALSTGGFSPHDASIGYYRLAGYVHYRWIEYILIIGMIMGGTNFLIHYRVVQGNIKSLLDTTEMKYWWTLIVTFAIIIVVERFLKLEVMMPHLSSASALCIYIEENVRTVLFQVVAIITTTGFATKDIGGPYFGFVAKQLFLVMMVIGGCIGSTGGGIKVFRISILFKIIQRELYRLRMPSRAVTTPLIDGKPIVTDEIYRVNGLFFTWIVLLVIGGCVTAFLSNCGSYESFSGMFSALGNIGPCYIPVRIMGQLNPAIKIMYIFGMLAGRLEILPVLLLFSPKAWRS